MTDTRTDDGLRDAVETIEAQSWRESFGLPSLNTVQAAHDQMRSETAEVVGKNPAWRGARRTAVRADKLYEDYAGKVAKVRGDGSTSSERKVELETELTTARDADLGKVTGELERALGLVERDYPPQPRVEVRTQEDAARLQTKLAAYPHWHPTATLDDVAGLVSRRDVVALSYLLPFLQRQVASPSPWWRPYLQDARRVVEVGRLVMASDKKAIAHTIAAERAETMRGQLAFALRLAAKGGWDRTLIWGTGALSEFDQPEDFVAGRRTG